MDDELGRPPGIPCSVLAGAGMPVVWELKKSSNLDRWASTSAHTEIVQANTASKQIFETLKNSLNNWFRFRR